MAAMPALISSKIWSLYIALTVVVVRDRYSLLLALKKKQKQKKKAARLIIQAVKNNTFPIVH